MLRARGRCLRSKARVGVRVRLEAVGEGGDCELPGLGLEEGLLLLLLGLAGLTALEHAFPGLGDLTHL